MIFQQYLTSKTDPITFNSIALYEAQLTFKTSSFLFANTDANLLQNMHREIFLPYKKLPIRWIPIEMTILLPAKHLSNGKCVRTFRGEPSCMLFFLKKNQ